MKSTYLGKLQTFEPLGFPSFGFHKNGLFFSAGRPYHRSQPGETG